jgi:hypothetical protein
MDLRCPKCNSNDLKKVSLAYEEGLFRSEGKTRLRAVVAGGSGPDLVVGRATTRGTQQSVLSKKLTPPVKWSYKKLVLWFAIISFIALVVYVRSVMSGPVPASSLPVTLYAILAPAAFISIVAVFWKHNHSTYQRQYAQWSQSFICERCGTVSQHDLPTTSLS